ncbi:MAG: hypothetical protein ACKO5E_19060 [bacterium]
MAGSGKSLVERAIKLFYLKRTPAASKSFARHSKIEHIKKSVKKPLHNVFLQINKISQKPIGHEPYTRLSGF